MRVQMGTGGRVVIPAPLRRAIGVGDGDTLLVQVEGGSLRLRPVRDAIAEAQAIVRRRIPEGVSLSDELIAERRAEARREEPGVAAEADKAGTAGGRG